MMMNRWSELVFVACLFRIASSQLGFGPGYCLLSRLDVVPCDNLLNLPSPDPGINQFSIYRTAFAPGSAGTPVCYLVGPPENVSAIQDIASIGNISQVKFLISPGIELEQPVLYGNQELVTYNVQCPPDHILYFNVTFADMEPPNCLGRCVDYLTVNRSGFGSSESCGSDTTANSNQLDLGSFIAHFRTSPFVRHAGFKATVICFKREESPPAGCTMPDGSGQALEETSPGSRRKRDLEEFHREWQWHLTYLKRMKRQLPGLNLRFEIINVAHQVIVNFTDKTLVFTDTKTNEILRRVGDVLFLHTFDAEGSIDEFRENGQDDKGRLIPFPGPGPLYIVGRHAYFQLFVIDPRGILPNANESAVISALTDGQFDAITLEDTPLNEDFLSPPTPNPVDIGLPPLRGARRKRQTQSAITFNEATIRMAREFQNACNPVLRASALATLQSANVTGTTPDVGSGLGSGQGMPTLTPMQP